MKLNKTSVSKSVSDNLLDLYSRIPDYAEVQHLGQSDFINTLESLKEEFRQCRASLYNEEFCSDSEFLADKSSSPINSRSKTSDNLYTYSSKFANNSSETRFTSNFGRDGSTLPLGSSGSHGKIAKINNHNLSSTTGFDGNSGFTSDKLEDRNTAGGVPRGGGQYLSIKSCELHRTPYRSPSAASITQPSRYLTAYGRSSFVEDSGKNDSAFQDDDDDDDDDDIDSEELRRNEREWSICSSNSDISISKWSSSPEIYRSRSRSKEFTTPSNVQQRYIIFQNH